MPSRRFAFEKGGPKRLETSWGGFWRNFTVKLDGNVVGQIATQKELKEGRTFTLPDGSAITVALKKSGLSLALNVLHNGKPLPGSDTDPEQKVKVAYGIIYFVGGLNILLGLITLVLNVELLSQIGFGIGSVIVGGIYAILGFFTSKRSMVALIIAIVLFCLDGILSLILMAAAGGTAVGGIVVRVFFVIAMVQGVGAMSQLKKESAAGSQSAKV